MVADQDPAEWLPPSGSEDVLCRYGAEWAATKLRWGLAVDELDRDRLLGIAAGCGGTEVGPDELDVQAGEMREQHSDKISDGHPA